MPTGVHLRNAGQQLFDAAERVLLRDGPDGLTSRAVTDEAGCAKGVLHRHFADFDAFLTDLVLDRAARLETQASTLLDRAGAGDVAGNLAEALGGLFGPVPMAIIPLVTFRDGLRARLRQAKPGGGITILAQATSAISGYLAEEQRRGRLTAGADIDALTLSLVGGGHLVFVNHAPEPPSAAVITKFVTGVVAGALSR
ncbi:TetR/AcrR family transcriptional regulator [Symbioplanes lichenis]|uniref:TetR/AcrR family transcriptional regulator n=1 Tax=Symbioplanes lichenis TaxID=1629072 RepID=UPI002738D87D|nr:TetR/AcrR family transcriptional regulator [Actinoplanes lichenis]